MIRRSPVACALLLASAAVAPAQPVPGGLSPADAQPTTMAAARPARPAQPPRRPVRDPAPAIAAPEPAMRVRVGGHVGFTSFTATDSFSAVLDTSSGAVLGGGGGLLIGRHLFVDAQISRFSAEGERVFITEALEVFPLGIATTVTVIPVDVSVGWRFTPAPRPPGLGARGPSRRPVPFVGGGVGVVTYRETAEFADPGDDVDDTHGSYHLLGGVELPVTRRLGVSADGLYRWVPDALGESGVSAAYGETDLGGVTVRVRVTFTF